MSAYTLSYENGFMVVTHSSGVINRYSIAQLQEHKALIENYVSTLQGECIAMDNRITKAVESVNSVKGM